MKRTAAEWRDLTLPEGKKDAIFFDDDVPGFGLRIRESGARTWVFQFKLAPKDQPVVSGRITLGSAKAITLAQARDGYTRTDKDGREIKAVGARHYHQMVKEGRNPQSEISEAKARAAQTFKIEVAEFLARKRGELRPRSYADLERHLLTHAKPLHPLQLTKIELADIAGCIDAVAKNRGQVTSNRVLTTLFGFFKWAGGKGLIKTNPAMLAQANRYTENKRTRVLTAAELRAVWTALEDDHYGAIVKLLMLTGQRANEIGGLERWEIRETEIVLQGARTKNHCPHSIPLSEAARGILARFMATPRMAPGGTPSVFVFGRGAGPFSGWSNCKERLDARIAKALGQPLPAWTIHDLRRTFATHCAEIGVEPHIIEAMLNHISGHKAGVAGIYNMALYEPAKRVAMARWADQLLAWVEGKETNVTPLRRA